MNKRVTIQIPDDLYRVISRYGDLHGLDPDDYATMALQRHLEDLQDIAAAEAAMKTIQSGEDRVVSSKEFWHGLDD